MCFGQERKGYLDLREFIGFFRMVEDSILRGVNAVQLVHLWVCPGHEMVKSSVGSWGDSPSSVRLSLKCMRLNFRIFTFISVKIGRENIADGLTKTTQLEESLNRDARGKSKAMLALYLCHSTWETNCRFAREDLFWKGVVEMLGRWFKSCETASCRQNAEVTFAFSFMLLSFVYLGRAVWAV